MLILLYFTPDLRDLPNLVLPYKEVFPSGAKGSFLFLPKTASSKVDK